MKARALVAAATLPLPLPKRRWAHASKFRRMRALESLENSPDNGAAAPAATLGDVLYAGKPKGLILEQDWVGLVHAIGAGDQRALHALYDRSHRLVFTLAMRITSNRERLKK